MRGALRLIVCMSVLSYLGYEWCTVLFLPLSMNRKTSTKKRFHYNAIWFWSFISVSRGPFWFAGPVTHRSGMLRACSKRDKSFTITSCGWWSTPRSRTDYLCCAITCKIHAENNFPRDICFVCLFFCLITFATRDPQRKKYIYTRGTSEIFCTFQKNQEKLTSSQEQATVLYIQRSKFPE